LVNIAMKTSTDSSMQLEGIDSSAKKQKCNNQPESAVAKVVTVPFEPSQPASASGLACLLLLLDEAASPLQLFSGSTCGPRLAIQCLSVRPTP
jgi:hypothetical protein